MNLRNQLAVSYFFLLFALLCIYFVEKSDRNSRGQSQTNLCQKASDLEDQIHDFFEVSTLLVNHSPEPSENCCYVYLFSAPAEPPFQAPGRAFHRGRGRDHFRGRSNDKAWEGQRRGEGRGSFRGSFLRPNSVSRPPYPPNT